MKESDLDRAFAEKVRDCREFQSWITNRTKFREISDSLHLLDKEQAESKPRKNPDNWWRHWWCRLEDGTESETDIFLVFSVLGTHERVALHVEDKPPHGEFTPRQYENYERRAHFMSGKNQFMNYGEYTTVLLAPMAFAERNADKVAHFDVFISYEDVAEHVEMFSTALREA